MSWRRKLRAFGSTSRTLSLDREWQADFSALVSTYKTCLGLSGLNFVFSFTVNVGLIGFAGYSLYNEPRLRSDRQFLTTASIGFLALFGLEGYAAERYVQTPEGRAEREKAKKEGAAVMRHTKEVVLRPGVLGGLVGVANLGVLGGVGYAAYTNWDRPAWDRRIVSAVTIGLLGLWGGEG